MLCNWIQFHSKKKWRNVCNAYVKNMKPSASIPWGRKKKAYYLSKAMKFTFPFVKVISTTTGNLPEMPLPDRKDLQVVSNDDAIVDGESLNKLSPRTRLNYQHPMKCYPTTTFTITDAITGCIQHCEPKSDTGKRNRKKLAMRTLRRGLQSIFQQRSNMLKWNTRPTNFQSIQKH